MQFTHISCDGVFPSKDTFREVPYSDLYERDCDLSLRGFGFWLSNNWLDYCKKSGFDDWLNKPSRVYTIPMKTYKNEIYQIKTLHDWIEFVDRYYIVDRSFPPPSESLMPIILYNIKVTLDFIDNLKIPIPDEIDNSKHNHFVFTIEKDPTGTEANFSVSMPNKWKKFLEGRIAIITKKNTSKKNMMHGALFNLNKMYDCLGELRKAKGRSFGEFDWNRVKSDGYKGIHFQQQIFDHSDKMSMIKNGECYNMYSWWCTDSIAVWQWCFEE